MVFGLRETILPIITYGLKPFQVFSEGIFYPSTKRTTGLPVGELVLWCGIFAPKGCLDWYHGLARGAPFTHTRFSISKSLVSEV